MKFREMRIGVRLGLSYGLILLLLVTLTLVGNNSMGKIQKNMDYMLNVSGVKMSLANDMLNSMAVISREMRTIMMLNNNAAKTESYKRIEGARVKYRNAFDKLKKMENTNEGKTLLAKLEDTIENTLPVNNRIIELGLANKTTEAIQLLINDSMPGMTIIDRTLEEIVKLEEEQNKLYFAEAMKAHQNALAQMLLIGAIAIILGVLVSIFITRSITRPLNEVVGLAEHIAARDLTVKVSPDNSRNEVSALIESFRKMTEYLREEIRQIMEGVNVLASAAAEISASTTQFASSATETAAAVSETTATMEEVRQTAQVSSQKANYVSDIAQKAVQVSQAGRKSVDDTVDRMIRIREQMESIAESIVRLSEQSQAIGEIISAVDDLAEQSNLLAVNASIEAAKAGDQGKGFAVVAQEIKSLAEQSKQATAQVRTILNDIQKATSAAVMATEQGAKTVDAGMKQSAEAGESIRAMAQTITEAAQAVTQIAATAQQQLIGMEQASLAMDNIREASAFSVEGAKQLESAARDLGELGQKLKQLVERYKV